MFLFTISDDSDSDLYVHHEDCRSEQRKQSAEHRRNGNGQARIHDHRWLLLCCITLYVILIMHKFINHRILTLFFNKPSRGRVTETLNNRNPGFASVTICIFRCSCYQPILCYLSPVAFLMNGSVIIKWSLSLSQINK